MTVLLVVLGRRNAHLAAIRRIYPRMSSKNRLLSDNIFSWQLKHKLKQVWQVTIVKDMSVNHNISVVIHNVACLVD